MVKFVLCFCFHFKFRWFSAVAELLLCLMDLMLLENKYLTDFLVLDKLRVYYILPRVFIEDF